MKLLKDNLGHLLTILTMVGSVFIVWHASEMRGMETATTQKALMDRIAALERHEEAFLARLEQLVVNQERISP